MNDRRQTSALLERMAYVPVVPPAADAGLHQAVAVVPATLWAEVSREIERLSSEVARLGREVDRAVQQIEDAP